MARELGPRKITFFPLTSDSGAEPVYGEPISLPWAVNFGTKNNYKEGEYKADMKVEKSTQVLESVDVEIEVSSDLPPKVEASICGNVYKDCKKITKSTTRPIEGAIAYEIVMDEDDYVRRRVIHKVTLSKEEQSNDVDSDGETFKFTGKGIALVSNDDIELTMDQKEVEESGVDPKIKAEWDAFFTKVVTSKTVTV